METPLATAPFLHRNEMAPPSDVPALLDAKAEYELGVQFANAGGRRNHAEAARHFLKAAAQNHVRAQVSLGAMYAQGHGVRRDRSQGLLWLSKAAHLGDAEAQYTLGMQQNRLSMDQAPSAAEESRIEAYKWLRLAAAQGHPDARAGCDFVSMGMTVDTVKEAMRRADAFVCVAERSA